MAVSPTAIRLDQTEGNAMTQPASPDQPIEKDPSEEVAERLQDMARRGVHRGPKESDEALRLHL